MVSRIRPGTPTGRRHLCGPLRRSRRWRPMPCTASRMHPWRGELAGLLELAALAVAITLEHQAQAVEGQMPIVVLDGAQIRQHQRCGVTRGHDRDVVATEPVD